MTVPQDMTAAEARREVRSLISDQANFMAWVGDVRVVSIKPIPINVPRGAYIK